MGFVDDAIVRPNEPACSESFRRDVAVGKNGDGARGRGGDDGGAIVAHQSAGRAFAPREGNVAFGIGVVDQIFVIADQQTGFRKISALHRSARQADIADFAAGNTEQSDGCVIDGAVRADRQVRNGVAEPFENTRETIAAVQIVAIAIDADRRPVGDTRSIERGGQRIIARKRTVGDAVIGAVAVDRLHIGHAVKKRVVSTIDIQRAAMVDAAVIDARAGREGWSGDGNAAQHGRRYGRKAVQHHPSGASDGNRCIYIERTAFGVERQPVRARQRQRIGDGDAARAAHIESVRKRQRLIDGEIAACDIAIVVEACDKICRRGVSARRSRDQGRILDAQIASGCRRIGAGGGGRD